MFKVLKSDYVFESANIFFMNTFSLIFDFKQVQFVCIHFRLFIFLVAGLAKFINSCCPT